MADDALCDAEVADDAQRPGATRGDDNAPQARETPWISNAPQAGVASRARDASRQGAVYGILAYGIWGLFPLYFAALRPAGAWEILSHRILWTALLCVAVLLVRRDLRWMRILRDRPRLAVAALLIAGNWVIYVAAVLQGHTTEAALGYFLNPVVTVALGVLVLREHLRPMQWAAVGIGALPRSISVSRRARYR